MAKPGSPTGKAASSDAMGEWAASNLRSRRMARRRGPVAGAYMTPYVMLDATPKEFEG